MTQEPDPSLLPEPNEEMKQDEDEMKIDTNPAVTEEQLKVRSHRLFLDDLEYQAFTRRLSWSPDGSILLTPASCFFDL